MPQHFIKSAKLRDLTLFDVASFTEEDAFWFFVESRWGSRSIIACPHCGVIDKHYFRGAVRKQWRCKHCDGYFSVTRGTPFEDRKLPFKKLLMGMLLFVESANGVSIHRLAQSLDIQVKTAHAFLGKIREVLVRSASENPMSGLVQVDGGYFGGRPRHGRLRRRHDPADIAKHVENQLSGTKDKKTPPRSRTARRNWFRKKKRRVVLVLRELSPVKGKGATRTVVRVCDAECDAHAVRLVTSYVTPGTKIMTDENAAYNRLSIWYKHETVEHAIEFSTLGGVNDNQAESFFSRLRRYVLGVSHRVEPKYLTDIATEMAWREDVRRKTNREKTVSILDGVFKVGRSRWWRGYWQGFHRPSEIVWSQSEMMKTQSA